MRNADVLDRILSGEQVEAASQEVQDLAQLASVLQGAWQGGPTKAATNRTRAAALSAFQENGNGSSAAPAPVRLARPSRGRRVLARVALTAALVAGLPAAAFAASEDALPGQMLYPVKRGFEEVRLALAGDPVDEARVLLGIAGERVEETIVAAALGLGPSAELAREGYEEAVARFEGRIVEAQALGLPVEDVVDEATALFGSYQQVFEAIFGPPPAATSTAQPTEVLSASAPPEADEATGEAGGNEGSKKAAGRDHDKRDGKKNRGEGGRDRAGGGGGGSGGGDDTVSGQSGGGNGGGGKGGGGNGGGGNGGGGNGGGGAGTAGGGEDAKEQEPPQPSDDDADDDEHSEGQGNGHDKAIGEGHHKDNGEGHHED